MALAGRFTDHHALLCRLHLDRIKVFDDAVDGLADQIAGKAAPWQRELDLLKTLPGFGDTVAQAWLAESVRNFVRRGGRQERFRRPQGVA
jgi:transposase